MKNPLSDKYSEKENISLVDRVLEGDSKALNQLVDIHQAFIYNVAWKMTHSNEDALDLTQDVLIKVITKLSTFKKESAFRTWLYRIVFNEFLQSKRKQKEKAFPSFEEHDRQLNAVPDPELTPEEELELKDYTREVKFRCTSAMLICLDREQRLIYLLGASFSIDHNRLTGTVPGKRDLYNKLVQYTLHSNKFTAINSMNCRMEVPQGEMVEFRYVRFVSIQFNSRHDMT